MSATFPGGASLPRWSFRIIDDGIPRDLDTA